MKLIFSFAYSELFQRSDNLNPILVRDISKFEAFGYSPTTPEDLKIQTNVLREIPTDDFWEGQQMLKTSAKNKARDDLDGFLQNLKHRISRCLDTDSVDYRLFRFNRMARINDHEAIVFAKNTIKSAESMATALEPAKVTAELLLEIKNSADNLDQLLDEQVEMEKTRIRKQAERIQLANELYRKISDICQTGKVIWKGKNDTYYDDYVIYGSSKSNLQTIEEENSPVEEENTTATPSEE
ncbi:hypothetical protein DMA11_08695 [Marinilabiliaceae bacterium JC017]|nr:hypothetical protein DMA11_08695 [Marinilabiliaceae bacterium JC017]